MDHLARVNMEARKRGLSYGKYVALAREGLVPSVPRDERTVPGPESDARTRECANCGNAFYLSARGRGSKYCSDKCYRAMNNRRQREKYIKVDRKPKPEAEKRTSAVCKQCGEEFSLENVHGSVKYCSEACRQKSHRRMERESYARKKASRAPVKQVRIGKCEHCGEVMPVTRKTRKYCSEACARAAMLAKARIRDAKRRAAKKRENEEC